VKKILILMASLAFAGDALSANLVRGEKINKSCALCHGQFGQGTPGQLSPRIAGLPKEYLIKATKAYRDQLHRNYPLMVRTSGLHEMTEDDIEDVAAYLASIDLSSDGRFNIHPTGGSAKKGHKIFKSDCKTCHAKDGYGKPRKEAPPLAGQHTAYLYTTMRAFRDGTRVHANDVEDDTFEDYTEQDYINLTAYIAGLDDKKIVPGYVFQPPVLMPLPTAVATTKTPEEKVGIEITDIKQTVVKLALDEGVSTEDAAQAMLSKAVELNLKLVGQQQVSQELEARGVETPHLSIYQFCNPLDAKVMVVANPVFSSYMPCRISMVEDNDGKMWLMMLNLDMLINSHLLPPDVMETAVKVNQQMLEVMVAGSAGDF